MNGTASSLSAWNTLDDYTVDPFLALKPGECIAEDIAYNLAPKRIPKPDDIRRSFCFSGPIQGTGYCSASWIRYVQPVL